MKRVLQTIALNCLFITTLHAGIIKGNGGNTLVCTDSTELLDIAEARLLQSASFTFLNLERRAEDRAEKIMSAGRVQVLRAWLQSWDSEVHFLKNVSLGEVSDSFHFAIPKGCSVVQTVIARDPLPGEKRYLVREEIYQALPAWQKSALKWHEVLYRQVIANRTRQNLDPELVYNSESTRKMVATLFADDSEALSSHQWAELFEDLD